ncbi:hypothetical protein FQZ97_319140 [compost metagenome]
MTDEEAALGLGFHAFGHDRQAEDMAQADDRAGDGGIVGVDQYVADEGLVDLQLVERQALQVGE